MKSSAVESQAQRWQMPGARVRACFLSRHAEARNGVPEHNELLGDIASAQAILGFGAAIIGSFPNIKLNTVSHLDLVQFVEKAIIETQPDVVFTHHPGDVNDDHVQTSRACQAAIRLFQRRAGVRRARLYLRRCCRPPSGRYRVGIRSSHQILSLTLLAA